MSVKEIVYNTICRGPFYYQCHTSKFMQKPTMEMGDGHSVTSYLWLYRTSNLSQRHNWILLSEILLQVRMVIKKWNADLNIQRCISEKLVRLLVVSNLFILLFSNRFWFDDAHWHDHEWRTHWIISITSNKKDKKIRK